MISFQAVTKRYGRALALDDLTVDIRSGSVTGLLGPNGAGKSTAMRILLGLDHSTAGTATFDGVPYARLEHPLRAVGASLDARSAHPGRSARGHLLGLARHAGIRAQRVDEVLGLVGLESVGRSRVGGFSLGMSQRLGIASALLGDPAVLVLDEPVNGLDTDGVRWIRGLLRRLADEGRTVVLSSHLLAELGQVADRVVVLGRGRLLHAGSVESLTTRTETVRLRLAEPADAELLIGLLGRERVFGEDAHVFTVAGATPAEVGDTTFNAGIRIHELTVLRKSLEDGYLDLVRDAVEYSADADGPAS